MGVIKNLMVRVGADFSGLSDGMRGAQHEVNSFGSKFKGSMAIVGAAVVGAGAVMVGFGKTMVNAAADSQALQSQYSQVMGKMKSDTDKYLDEMSKKWNKHPNELKSAYLQYVAILKSKGVAEKEAHELAKQYLDRTVDANAFANEDMATTTERFMAGIKGEYDSLDTAMVNLSQTMLNDTSVKEYGKKFDELTVAQQESLKASIMLKQHTSAGVLGQGVREADSYANNLAMVKQKWNDVMVSFGNKALPIVNDILKKLAEDVLPNLYTRLSNVWSQLEKKGVIDDIKKSWDNLKTVLKWSLDNLPLIGAAIAGVTTKIAAQFIIERLVTLYNSWKLATQTMTTVQWLFNAAMAANPIGLVASAIGLLTTGFILAYQNCEPFRKAVDGFFDSIKNKIQHLVSMYDWLKKVFSLMGDGKWSSAWDVFVKGTPSNPTAKKSKNVSHKPNIGRVPMMATGGVVDRPTIAMIGEAGREAVVPLENNTGWMSTMANAIAQNINMNSRPTGGDVILNIDGRQFARIIKPYNDLENKRVGTNVRLQSI